MASRHSNGGMVVTRTPLRVSFAGGGTDLPVFYQKEQGAVFSTAITQYVYVTVKEHSPLFLDRIRVNYSKSEEVNSVGEIKNDIARECLRFLDIDVPIYISTVGDVPASTGLGGSSAFAVGLLSALHTFKGERASAGQLAEEACHIEIDVLGEPIGKQDQYAAAVGGVNVFCFEPDGRVTVEHQRLAEAQRRELFGSMMMFWTGHQRDARTVLAAQQRKADSELDRLRRMREQVRELQALVANGRLDMKALGGLLDEGWRLKRALAPGITSDIIDQWYDGAVRAGAYGGKLCGAGGGGFLLLVVPPDRQNAVRQAMGGLSELSVEHEAHGSQVVVALDR